MLSVDNIHYSVKAPGVGAREIIKGLSIIVPTNEWISLVGPNGCGKSTLLHLMAGLLKPAAGTVNWNGEPPGKKIWDRSEIGLLFQDLGLLDHLTVMKNLEIAIQSKIDKSQKISAIWEVAEKLGIEKLVRQKVYKLSGGEKQRIAIARLMLQKPALILLDEPLNSLDGAAREKVLECLLEWKSTVESTAIQVTHQMDEACMLGDKIGVMKNGVIPNLESPMDLYFKPPTEELARAFNLPPINLLPSELIRHFAGMAVFEIKCNTVGFRPSCVFLSKSIHNSGNTTNDTDFIKVPCRYINKETYWGKSAYLLKIEGYDNVVRVEESWDLKKQRNFTSNDSVEIVIPLDSLITFN